MRLKIGGLSLAKLPEINEMAALAVKNNLPLNNLTVCAKLAESLLHSVLLKDSVNRKFDAPFDAFASLKRTQTDTIS